MGELKDSENKLTSWIQITVTYQSTWKTCHNSYTNHNIKVENDVILLRRFLPILFMRQTQ